MTDSNKKRILIYAHYYDPDVASTGQILQDIAEGLSDAYDITVICTVPSYTGTIEKKYKTDKFYNEELNGVKLIRVSVPEFSKSSKTSRIRNLLAYSFNARKATKMVGKQDYVLAISQPPILGGMLGVYGRNRIKSSVGKHPKFIYCIQDFNPEQIEAVGYIKNMPLLCIARALDNRSCRKSDLVITVGRDLVETLEKRFKGSKVPRYTMINNWINEKIIYPLSEDDPGVVLFKNTYKLNDKFVFMYSGNIGLYYDLEGIIQVIGRFKGAKTPDGKDVAFAFVGAGSVLEKLKEYKNKHLLDNVVFIPYQNKDRLIYSLNAADVHFCVNAKGIKGVSCPSKFYGIVAVSKPVLGVLEKGSEVEMLVNEIGCGVVSEPGNYDAVEKNIQMLIDSSSSDSLHEMGAKGFDFYIQHLTIENGIKMYKKCILNLLDET